MSRRLPPLNALIAFDAVARHLSFTAAADELCITQSAVSQRIRLLEEFLFAPLFLRLPRRLEMTERALELAPVIQDMLDQLERVLDQNGRQSDRVTLAVSVAPSFAAKWLMVHISSFFKDHPEIKCRIISTSDPSRPDVENFDLSIRWGLPTDWPGMQVIRFIDCEMFPVCHPDLVTRGGGLSVPTDLSNVILLRHSGHDYWSEWLRAADVDETTLSFGLEYDDDAMALAAALQGYGVCLTTSALAWQELEAGSLVRPFNVSLRWDRSYYLVYRKAKAGQPKIMAFQKWLLRTGSYAPAEIVASGRGGNGNPAEPAADGGALASQFYPAKYSTG